jgi:hypothetical protein
MVDEGRDAGSDDVRGRFGLAAAGPLPGGRRCGNGVEYQQARAGERFGVVRDCETAVWSRYLSTGLRHVRILK